MSAIVVEQGLAAAAGGAAGEAVAVVPRARRGRPRRGWRELSADAALEALEAAGPGAVTLARPAAADPGAACLPALARMLGREAVLLPASGDVAAWVVAVAAAWAAGAPEGLVRRLQALPGAVDAPTLPRRAWGAAGVLLPAVRPSALARWAGCAWRPCPACGGGGAEGGPCGRCGGGTRPAGAPA